MFKFSFNFDQDSNEIGKLEQEFERSDQNLMMMIEKERTTILETIKYAKTIDEQLESLRIKLQILRENLKKCLLQLQMTTDDYENLNYLWQNLIEQRSIMNLLEED